MRKRVLCTLLSGILIAGLSACTSGGGGSAAPAADSQPAASADRAGDTAPADSTVEAGDASGEKVTIMAWWEGGEQEAGKAKVEACQEELGVTLEANYIPYNEYLGKLNTLAAAGNMPDVFALPEFLVYDWGEKGMLTELGEAYTGKGVDLGEAYLPQSIFETGGKTWAVGYDITTMFLYYNKEMFDAAGLDYPASDVANPWTWAQYVEAARKMTKDSAGKTPADSDFNKDDIFVYGTKMPTGWTAFLPLLYSNGSGVLTGDGSALAITKPEGVEVMQAVADLSLKEYCAPNFATAKGAFSDSSTMLMNGQLGMLIDGGWAFSNYGNESFDVGVAPVPMFKQPADLAWTCGFCVSATSAKPDAAVEVHRWFTDFSNYIDACEKAGVSLGGLPQSNSVYDSPEYVSKWASLHSQQMVDTATAILQADSTRKGENTTVKNFAAIMDDTLIPQLDKVWLGEITAEEALSTMDEVLADKVDGYWA